MAFDFSLLLRLVVSVILGGLVGLERGGNKHDAGLRTHIIVCLGSASVMVVSECIIKQYNISSEIMRMGAQVISGVGFLGVGTIIADGNRVRGLTTAAGLWTTACVGVVVGSGYYIIAVTIVALMLFTMLGLRPLTTRLQNKPQHYTISLEIESKESLPSILNKLTSIGVEISKIKYDNEPDLLSPKVQMDLSLPPSIKINDLIYNIGTYDGVMEFIIL